MKAQEIWNTGLMRAMLCLLGVLSITLLLASTARAENLSRYHPQALIEAEWALEQGEPQRALAHLHRQRAVLRQGRFRAESNALACQAYRQLQDWQEVAQVCNTAIAYDDEAETVKPLSANQAFKQRVAP